MNYKEKSRCEREREGDANVPLLRSASESLGLIFRACEKLIIASSIFPA